MKTKIALAMIRRFLKWAPDWHLIWRPVWKDLLARARAFDKIEDAVRETLTLVEPLKEENDRLRAQVEQQEAAYAALMEEMEELLHG